MIKMSDIRKRYDSLNFNYVQESSINISTLADKAKTTRSINILESYLKCWNQVETSNEFAFIECLNILESFCKNSTSSSDVSKAIVLFSEMVLPKVQDAKKAKIALEKFVYANNLGSQLLQECNTYISCDRVLSNHEKLVKRKSIETLIRESSLVSEDNIDDCILELCNTIDSLNMDFSIKYSVALENISYLLDKHVVQHDKKHLLESINNYFLCNTNRAKLNVMASIMLETQLYPDDVKFEVLREFDLFGMKARQLNRDKGFAKENCITMDEYNSKYRAKLVAKHKESVILFRKLAETLDCSLIPVDDDDMKQMVSISVCKQENFDRGSKPSKFISKQFYIGTLKINTYAEQRYKDIVGVKLQNKVGSDFDIISTGSEAVHYFITIPKYIVNPKFEKELLSETVHYLDNDDDLDVVLDSDKEDKFLADFAIKESAKEGVKDLLNSFKLLADKSPEKLKAIVTKFYTKSPTNIVEETPNFLMWMRTFLVFSTFGISPYLGVITFFADQIVKSKMQQDHTKKMIDNFIKEKDKAEKKLAKCKNDAQKEKLKAYISTLEKNIKTIKDYEDTLYTAEENDARSSNSDDFNLESADIYDVTIIPAKHYIQAEHSKVVQEMYKARKELESICNSKYKSLLASNAVVIEDLVELHKFENLNIDNLPNYIGADSKIYVSIGLFLSREYDGENGMDVLNDICDYIQNKVAYDYCILYEGSDDLFHIYISYNNIISFDNEEPMQEMHVELQKSGALIVALENEISDLVDEDIEEILSFVDDNIDQLDMETVDTLTQFSIAASDIIDPEQLVDIFTEAKANIYKNDKSIDRYKKTSCLQENIYKLKAVVKTKQDYSNPYSEFGRICNINEALHEIKNIMSAYKDRQVVSELAFLNTMKLVQQRLKKKIQTLSDKEKSMSAALDHSVDKFTYNMQKNLTNKNREAVIKGSIIPSASSVLKIAVASGVAYAINPAIAVIGVLGGLAASKMATHKEKQFILDEIDIHLKLVEKKIQLAERNDDMKAVEELLKIQQKLKREKARIEYKRKGYMPSRKED